MNRKTLEAEEAHFKYSFCNTFYFYLLVLVGQTLVHSLEPMIRQESEKTTTLSIRFSISE